MAAPNLEDIVYVVDENLIRLARGIVALRNDTACFSRFPLDEILPSGINDPDWIPIVGAHGWVTVTSDRRIRTRPAEAQLAIDHKLKVVHLQGKIGSAPAWEQLRRLAARWENIENQVACAPEGPWWLSVRRSDTVVMTFEPGKPER